MPLALTQGEPAGVGPDIAVALLAGQVPAVAGIDLHYFGDLQLLQARAKMLGVKLPATRISQHSTHIPLPPLAEIAVGQPQRAHAGQVLACLRAGHQACIEGICAGLVTLPVQKSTLASAEPTFRGQTDYLARLCRREGAVTMLIGSDALHIGFVTTHLPLRAVASAITAAAIARTLTATAAYVAQKQTRQVRLTVLALNPHAGEDGVLGSEELETIIPAITAWQQQRGDSHAAPVHIQGPLPADTAFLPEIMRHTDCYISMYHDQALPLLKHLDFARAVNTSLGLPYTRTSPDHGTALALAGTGQGDASSTAYAILEAHPCATANH